MTKQNKSEISDYQLSTRRNTSSSPNIKVLDNGVIREYVDNEGYKVWEYETPNRHMVFRYNDEKLIYSNDYQIRYNGPINSNLFDNEGDSFFNKELFDFDRDFRDFDDILSDLDKFDTEFDEWMEQLDKWLCSCPPYPTVPRLSSNGSYSQGSTQIHSRTTSTSRSTRTRRRTRTRSNNSGCLGCFLWTILFFVIVCLVLYGMGNLGGMIIDFFKGLF